MKQLASDILIPNYAVVCLVQYSRIVRGCYPVVAQWLVHSLVYLVVSVASYVIVPRKQIVHELQHKFQTYETLHILHSAQMLLLSFKNIWIF